jgi:hypothetical protein
MKSVLVLLVTLLSVFPVCAQEAPLRIDWIALAANAGGHAADASSTYRFLTNGSGCVESNPRLGLHPSTSAVVTTAAVSFGITTAVQLGLTWWGNHAATSRGRSIAKWGARSFGYGIGAVRTRSAIRNVALCAPGRTH